MCCLFVSQLSCQDPAHCPDSHSILQIPNWLQMLNATISQWPYSETGSVYHPLTSKTHFVPAKGHPTIPRNRRKKGWIPCLGLLVPNPLISKAAAVSKEWGKAVPTSPRSWRDSRSLHISQQGNAAC